MYWLMSIDTVIRIAFAMALLFVIVPALAAPRRNTATWLEGFFWNFGVGITLITLVGQLLTLGNLFSLLTLLLAAGLVILLGQSSYRGLSPLTLVRQSSEATFLAFLNMFDRRVSVPRRIRRGYRRAIQALRQKTLSTGVRAQMAGWVALTAIAAAFRLYRPLASANLGFSDTYVHLYLLKLLEEGRQVDPQWGPYPRGMHFLLMAIHQLTNVDQILLMNFFGAFLGVLMTLAVADAARRLSGSVAAGLLSGFLFATFVGGPSQSFFVVGPDRYDLALLAFHRQTSTLSHELAITLLFPAAMFLLDFFRKRERWHLIGFAGCTAAIAAVHSGVLLPLVLISALALLAIVVGGGLTRDTVRRAVATGALAVLVGSTWAVAFVAYPYSGGKSAASFESYVGKTALKYFPFLGSLAEEERSEIPRRDARLSLPLTPALFVCILLALGLTASAFRHPGERRANLVWISAVFLLFVLAHFASTLGLPQIVEMRRNSQWLIMSMVILIGVAAGEIGSFLRRIPKLRVATAAATVVLLLLWTSRVPLLSEPLIHSQIVDYSGYGGTALAVLRIGRSFEPFTWTLISYGQEFPMVLRRGFHLPAVDFLERYDPTIAVTPIPTPHIFVIVEKTPHRFQIVTWAQRFSREELGQRLQTWVYLYQTTHKNLRVFFEDQHVRVYQIERTIEEIETMSRQASR